MDFESQFTYTQWKDELKEYFQWFEERNEGIFATPKELIKRFQVDYLGYYSRYQEDERIRLCIILPLIKFEIINNVLTPELREELEIYYEDFSKGVLDDFLSNTEFLLIRADLLWCNGYKDSQTESFNMQTY